jgi:hypothetical protein
VVLAAETITPGEAKLCRRLLAVLLVEIFKVAGDMPPAACDLLKKRFGSEVGRLAGTLAGFCCCCNFSAVARLLGTKRKSKKTLRTCAGSFGVARKSRVNRPVPLPHVKARSRPNA